MHPLFYGLFVFLLLEATEATIDSECYDSGLSIGQIVRNLSSCGLIENFSENFGVADVNKDGNLSPEEFESQCFKRFEELLFCNFDTNRDGTLNVDEFTLGEEKRITSDDIMEEIDTDHDFQISDAELKKILELGFINYSNIDTVTFPMTYTAFAGFLRQLPNETFPCMENATCTQSGESFTTAFSNIDQNKDGAVSIDELIISTYDVSLKNEFFTKMDLNGDALISNEEWTKRLDPEATKRWFEVTYFNKHDLDKDGKWNKTELSSYLQEQGLEDRHAWYIIYKNKGSLILIQAIRFAATIPDPNFRIIVETDEAVLNDHYVKGIPHDKRTFQ